MIRDEIFSFSAFELARKIREKQIRAKEAVEAVFQNIDERESNICAYISLDKEAAMKEARHCDEQVLKGSGLPPLFGVPVAVKDNLLLKGRRTTCGSRMLENHIPPFTATCVQKLQEAGAIIIGKTNMDEFGMGISTEHSFFGPTKNPLDPARVPGGSSGGSAAAVSGDMAFAALGTDTGGSIRQPAAYCGLVGLRPTYGTVSRHGLVAFSSSMDTAGPLTRKIRDAAGICNIVTGVDVKDQTSVSCPIIDIISLENAPVKGMRIGIPRELSAETDFEDGYSLAVSPEVKNTLTEAVRILEEGKHVLSEEEKDGTVSSVPELVLEPQSELKKVRRYLAENGWKITDENMVLEDGKFYPVLKAVRGTMCLTETEALYGPVLLRKKHEVLRQYLDRERQVLLRAAENLKKADENRAKQRREELSEKVRINQEAMGSIKT